MKYNSPGLMIFLSLLGSLQACKLFKNGPEDSQIQAAEGKTSDAFNLAEYIKGLSGSSPLKDQLAPGASGLSFGRKERFLVAMNFTAMTDGSTGFFAGKNGISGRYWLSGNVFGKNIGKGDKGHVMEAGADAGLQAKGVDVYLRFLGDDKYRSTVTSSFDNKFVRDLNVDQVIYPIPLLGIKVGGNIGGELGLKSTFGSRADDALNLIFRPLSNLQSGLSGGIELLHFADAKISGSVRLLELQAASHSSLGKIAAEDFIYGSNSFDTGDVAALDGKIEILAKAGPTGLLPGDVDKTLWNYLLDKVGIDPKAWAWKHSVWDPKPITESNLPTYATRFMKFMKGFADRQNCLAKKNAVQAKITQHIEQLRLADKDLLGAEQKAHEASMQSLNETLGDLNRTCL